MLLLTYLQFLYCPKTKRDMAYVNNIIYYMDYFDTSHSLLITKQLDDNVVLHS